MGNCSRRESSALVWADSISPRMANEAENARKEWLLGSKVTSSSSSSSSHSSSESDNVRVVKIKMTKKQLEKLVARVELQGLTMEQVLGRMMNGSDVYGLEHHGSWRPALQSIPEVN